MKIVTADITGSLIVNGVDVTNNVVSSSVFSGSIAGRVTNLEQFSASLDATFATDASVTASILVLSQSVQASQAALNSSYTATSASYLATSASYVVASGSYAAASASLSIRTTNLESTSSTLTTASASFATVSSSYASASGSLSTRTTNLEATASVNTQASASFAAYSASMSTRLTTDETNITTLTNASASFANQSASLSTRLTTDETNYTNLSSSFVTTSGSIAGRVTLIEGQYATTGSNTFTKPQQITDVSNAIGFTSTASLYTDGGLRVKGAAYISGTAYFNDVVVYGTSSIEYITSSQLAIGTNIITLNTDTPSIRYGGISVYDSGSNNLSTGSLFWDSEKDKWIYSNPSGSTYDGGMLISGPRNTSGLGNEVGTTSCALMMGQGGDHITSSAIFSYGNATCFYGNSYISGSGLACFAGTVCASSATLAGNLTLNSGGDRIININDTVGNSFQIQAASNVLYHSARTTGGSLAFRTNGTNDSKLTIDSAGAATFACSVGTTALNMNNMASLGSIGGGSIYLPYTAVIMFRTTDGATARAKITADNSNNLFLNSDGGSVGIGTSSPSAELQVNKNCDAVVAISNCIGVITGNRGSLAFYNCATSTVGLIRAAAVTDNVGTELQFHIRPAAGNLSQTMTITSDGYVAVVGNQGLKCVPYLQGMSFGWNRSNGQGESMINWTNAGGGTACDLVFNFRDSTTLYERLRLSSAGTLYFGVGAGAYEQMTLCYSGYNGGSPITTLMPSTVPGSGALTTFLLLKSNGLGLASGCNHMGLNVQSATYLASCNGAVGIGTINTGAILTICNPAQSSTSTVTWQNGGRIKGNLYSDTGGIAIYTGEEFNSAAMYMVGNDQIQFRICSSTPKLLLTNAGCIACFAGTVCVPSLVARSSNITINPSTYNWYSVSDNSFKVLDFGKFGSVYSYQDGACYSGFANNVYFANSTFDWRYKNTAGASNLFFQNGIMYLETAGSGTADTPVSLTTKLQVSACGQLTMYSKTDPGALTVVSAAPSSQCFLTFYDNGQNGNCIVASMVDANGANAAGGLSFTVWRKSNAAGLRLISNNIIDDTATGSEPVMNLSSYSYCNAAMTIKTPSVGFNHMAYAFNYNDTELFKIRASGTLVIASGIGGVSNARLIAYCGGNGNANGLGLDMGGCSYEYSNFFAYGTADNGRMTFGSWNSNTYYQKMIILGNGNIGVPGNATAIYNASDCRLKENVNVINDGIGKIMCLNPVSFNWKESFIGSEQHCKTNLGFLAQEVQTAIPEAVEAFGGSDIHLNKGTLCNPIIETVYNPLRVNEKFLLAVAVKAIQEQQCRIKLLESCLGIM